MTSNSLSRYDRVMTHEQFTQVVEAILAGKYSWACVLILRFAGYNPLHYIPYRTYNRLEKENQPRKKNKRAPSENGFHADHLSAPESSSFPESLPKIEDLGYLEPLQNHANPRGGNRSMDGDQLWTMVARLKWK